MAGLRKTTVGKQKSLPKAKAVSTSKLSTKKATTAQMTPNDRKILRDHAAALKKSGGSAAAKELERMNKMYAKYGMSFGKLPGV
jgi:hypothetical protein